VVDQLHGKNVHDLINTGKEKMSAVSFGATPVAVPSGGAPAAATAAAEAPKGGDKAAAPPKEEKKEESEESDADMGFSLFD
ncbi:60S acidic ribosomal protein P2, partial [Taenia solium]